eukprot:4873035-Prymnesium_polylepis.1
MDRNAIQKDLENYQRPAATPEQLAPHLPAWAASLMLDDDAQESYEYDMSSAAARDFNAIDGRTWEGLEYDDDAGLPSFTASEIADDYSIPLEIVFERIGQLGVDIEEHSVNTPVKSICNEEQIKELLNFVALTDPIAARESLADVTVFELSQEGGGDSPLAPDALVRLCKEHDIAAVLGADTRLNRVDHEALVALAEREAAFM